MLFFNNLRRLIIKYKLIISNIKFFKTISACDEHAAKPHYHMDLETGKKLITNKSYYLVDSGGQYRDGTTDVTRTIYNGTDEPDLFFRKQFTRVLKGHINTALMNFPSGISGLKVFI